MFFVGNRCDVTCVTNRVRMKFSTFCVLFILHWNPVYVFGRKRATIPTPIVYWPCLCICLVPAEVEVVGVFERFFPVLLYRFSAFWLRSKCSICSYQLNIWYVLHWRTSILNWFLDLGHVTGACSAIPAGWPGIAVPPGSAHHINPKTDLSSSLSFPSFSCMVVLIRTHLLYFSFHMPNQ